MTSVNMGNPCISVLSVFATVPRCSLARPLSLPWRKMKTKRTWDASRRSRRAWGKRLLGTTINFYVGLGPHRENALTDAPNELSSSERPKHVLHYSFAYTCTHMRRSCADTVNTYPRGRSLTLYCHTQTHLRSWIPSSTITAYPPRQSP